MLQYPCKGVVCLIVCERVFLVTLPYFSQLKLFPIEIMEESPEYSGVELMLADWLTCEVPLNKTLSSCMRSWEDYFGNC